MVILRILLVLFSLISGAISAEKPHILFILADDLGKCFEDFVLIHSNNVESIC